MSLKHKSASARRRHRHTVSKRTKLLRLGLRPATMRPIPFMILLAPASARKVSVLFPTASANSYARPRGCLADPC
jgi:hypothetical protein